MGYPNLEMPLAPSRDESVAPGSARAATMLVLTTLFWGVSFPLVKNWQEAAGGCPGGAVVASLTLVALRMGLSLLVLAVALPRLFAAPTRQEHLFGLAIGLAFFAGFVLQVWGMAYTTPAMSGFFTCLGGAWVPILVWALFRMKVPRVTLLGIGLAVLGAAVLGLQLGAPQLLGWGDTLTLVSSVFFALQIVLLDRLGRRVRSDHVTVGLLTVAGVLSAGLAAVMATTAGGLSAWVGWTAQMLSDPHILTDLALLTVLSTVLAFHWMNTYQPVVGASRAALIYFLEPVFAALFSIAWGHDSVTPRLLLGGLLILAGNLLVEAPLWGRGLRRSLDRR
jgi:drug/metabolite transporter (DMT)-like permease